MKVLVPVKRVVDANIRIRVKSDNTGVETTNVKMAMNPFCEIAVEEALRIREAGVAEEVIIMSAGPEKAAETIRTGLAMGADRGVHALTDERLEPLVIARLIKSVAEREGTDLVILGKQSIDDDNNQTGQMLAALMGRPLW
ncbi:MAG: electron transfer flavoprotein subunit beta/FixA family protein, partial [Gammaproteobacteria bacterium]|nr:electron transfer flavoprotein subunit beta/FixA family protein [Gammaproteobacteria bacterium]